MAGQKVSVCVEIDSEVYSSLLRYVKDRPSRSHDRAIESAIALLLLQHGGDEPINLAVKRAYLDGVLDLQPTFTVGDRVQIAAGTCLYEGRTGVIERLGRSMGRDAAWVAIDGVNGPAAPVALALLRPSRGEAVTKKVHHHRPAAEFAPSPTLFAEWRLRDGKWTRTDRAPARLCDAPSDGCELFPLGIDPNDPDAIVEVPDRIIVRGEVSPAW
jgi:Protein of unknown function (DUF2811)